MAGFGMPRPWDTLLTEGSSHPLRVPLLKGFHLGAPLRDAWHYCKGFLPLATGINANKRGFKSIRSLCSLREHVPL